MTRRAILMLSFLAIACSSGDNNDDDGDPTGPNPPPTTPFPAVSGAFAITATFDALPSAVAAATGTVTFTQPSRQVGMLSGSANVLANINGDVFQIQGMNNPSVTESGAITFSVGQSASATWVFTGTVSGTTMTGRHTLTGSSGGQSGPWSATRTGASAVVSSLPVRSPVQLDRVLREVKSIR